MQGVEMATVTIFQIGRDPATNFEGAIMSYDLRKNSSDYFEYKKTKQII